MSPPALQVRLGSWLFRHRGWLPVLPLLALVAGARPGAASLVLGFGLALPAEVLRLWAARAIGPASRTRGAQPGPLACAGPYRWSRNPIYLANIALHASFALASGWWPAFSLPLLSLPYHRAIVAWEEQRLGAAHGEAYGSYCALVPRWLSLRPRLPAGPLAVPLRAALRAERASLVAIAAVFGALALRLLG